MPHTEYRSCCPRHTTTDEMAPKAASQASKGKSRGAAAAASGSKGSSKRGSSSLWLATNPGKRWTEVFFLAYSPFWILWALCILVPFKLYDVRRLPGAAGQDVFRSGPKIPLNASSLLFLH